MTEHQYRNIVELLVEQEVEHQLSKLPSHVTELLPSIQVVTYVLNRMKPFYACTERGFEEQLKRAEQELRGEIRKTVKIAMNLVYQNPIHGFSPLQEDSKEAALKKLRGLLQDESIQWHDLPKILGSALDPVIHGLPRSGEVGGVAGLDQQSGRPYKSAASSRWTYKQRAAEPDSNSANLSEAAPSASAPQSPDQFSGSTWQDFKRRRDAARQAPNSQGNSKDTGTSRNYRLSS